MSIKNIISRRAFLLLSILLISCYGSKSVDSGGDETNETDESTDDTDDAIEADDVETESCQFGSSVCIEYGGDTATWCGGVGGSYQDTACPQNADAICDIPGGTGDFMEPGTAYYYNHPDPASACTGAGGTLRP